MLTIKAPIELKSRGDFITCDDSFPDRITANYGLIGNEIGSEELLHMAATQPEIYIASGDLMTVAGNTMINSRNEEKLSIVNNVLNRILISDRVELTYQDRAYITDVLHKLGIKDDRRFMEQIRQEMNDYHSKQRLVELSLFQEVRQESERTREELLTLREQVAADNERNDPGRRELYLSEKITERLGTGDIYEIVSNFNRSIYDNRIEPGQVQVAEQSGVAQILRTEELVRELPGESGLIYREEAQAPADTEPQPFLREQVSNYYHYNTQNHYERDMAVSTIEGKNVTNEVSAAVFLDIVKNLYRSDTFRQHRRNTADINLTNALIQSSSNTLIRLNRMTVEDMFQSLTERGYFEAPEVSLSYLEESPVTETELTEIADSQTTLEQQLLAINENNRQNLSRYEQMMQLLSTTRQAEVTEGSGEEKTRRESLRALADGAEILSEIAASEEEANERAESVFTEVEKLLPERTAEIFRIVEEYRKNPASVTDERVLRVTDLTETAREFERLSTEAQSGAVFPAERGEPGESEIVYRREEPSAESVEGEGTGGEIQSIVTQIANLLPERTSEILRLALLYRENPDAIPPERIIYREELREAAAQLRRLSEQAQSSGRAIPERVREQSEILYRTAQILTQSAEVPALSGAEGEGEAALTVKEALGRAAQELRLLEAAPLRELLTSRDEIERSELIHRETEGREETERTRLLRERTEETLTETNERTEELTRAAEELRRIREAPAPSQRVERTELTGSELIHRVTESLSAQELSEIINQVRSTTAKEIKRINTGEDINIQNVTVRQETTEVRNRITQEEQDEISEMIARGVRSQVGAISNEVLHRL
ncbi:MAG: hypothetical protein IJ073_05065, partial [Lachnospiraceae bacterium]|nr:hypothetical protein [Lachnospiraceae bacterium]